MTLPDAGVLTAFGLWGNVIPLAGGEGRSVRVGDAVLKPVGDDTDLACWLAELMDSIVVDGFRVARPLRTLDGSWSSDGWTASTYVDGAEPPVGAAPRWSEIITAGRAFHRAIAHVPCPSFLGRRSDPWAIGDRVSWREAQVEIVPELDGVHARLAALITHRPDQHAQLVHGDLSGNVLFADDQAPAVIDFSPYWRPTRFAEAIVVADAMLWHGADVDLLDQLASDDTGEPAGQVARAVIFRLVVTSEFSRTAGSDDRAGFVAEFARYERVARRLETVVEARRRR